MELIWISSSQCIECVGAISLFAVSFLLVVCMVDSSTVKMDAADVPNCIPSHTEESIFQDGNQFSYVICSQPERLEVKSVR
jgi:hypothetical protein